MTWKDKLDGHALEPIAPPTHNSQDNDIRKGATEDDRPGPERSSHPGLDGNGLPNDATAIAQDVLGAEIDDTQG